jgi:hypothetical protein
VLGLVLGGEFASELNPPNPPVRGGELASELNPPNPPVRGGELASKLNVLVVVVRGVICGGEEGALEPKPNMLDMASSVDVKFRSLQARI